MPTRIELAAIEPGMVLSEPVLNRQGQVLLAAGVELTARHRTVFQTWGVRHVTIKSGDGQTQDGAPAYSDEIIKRAILRVDRRMRWQPRNSLEKEAYNLAVTRAANLLVRTAKD